MHPAGSRSRPFLGRPSRRRPRDPPSWRIAPRESSRGPGARRLHGHARRPASVRRAILPRPRLTRRSLPDPRRNRRASRSPRGGPCTRSLRVVPDHFIGIRGSALEPNFGGGPRSGSNPDTGGNRAQLAVPFRSRRTPRRPQHRGCGIGRAGLQDRRSPRSLAGGDGRLPGTDGGRDPRRPGRISTHTSPRRRPGPLSFFGHLWPSGRVDFSGATRPLGNDRS